MTLRAAAKQASVSYTHARDLASRGKFPGAFQLGHAWRVHRAIFQAELEQLARGEGAHVSPDEVLAQALREAHQRVSNGRK